MSKIFEALVVPRKQLASAHNKYRIYKTATDFIDVSAGTVKEALETSGITDALKVEVNFLSSLSVIDAGVLAEAQADPQMPPPAAQATADAAAAPA